MDHGCLEEDLDVSPQDWDSVVLSASGVGPGHPGLQQTSLRRSSFRCGRHQAGVGSVPQPGWKDFGLQKKLLLVSVRSMMMMMIPKLYSLHAEAVKFFSFIFIIFC